MSAEAEAAKSKSLQERQKQQDKIKSLDTDRKIAEDNYTNLVKSI